MRRVLLTSLLICLVSLAPISSAKSEGPTPEDVTFVQGLLERFGYDPGPIDGICGDLTVAAVRAFHRDRNLPLEPGDIEPQAATVAGNLMTAFSEGVMHPTHPTPNVYQQALKGDVAAAIAVGRMYHEGKGVPVDNMMAYAWWTVAEINGHAPAKEMKQGLVSAGEISEHEMTYGSALADQISGRSGEGSDGSSSTENRQRPSATM